MKRFIVLILIFVMLSSLVACENEEGSLIGTWKRSEDDGFWITYELKEDGTVIERSSVSPAVRCEGTYLVDGDRLVFTMEQGFNENLGRGMPLDVVWEFSYRLKGNKLFLIYLYHEDDSEVTFIRE